LFCDDETLETDPEQFECSTCEVRQQLDGLSSENAEAWQLYQRLLSRFLVDLLLVPDMFRHLTADWTHEQIVDRLERLMVMYDILSPPPPSPS